MEGRHSEEVSNEFVVEDITFEHQGSECKMRDSVQTLKTTRRNIRYRRAIVYSETDRGMNSDNKHHEKPPNPCATASILSALTMSWTLGLFREGYKRELDVEDLYIPLKEHQSSLLGDKLEEKWKSEVSHGCKKNRDASLLRAILKTFGWKILGLGIILVVTELVTKVAQPMFLARLLRYFTPGSNISKQEAYIYAAGIITATAVNIFVLNPFWMCLMHIGMKIRVACCSLIYRKALRLSRTALGGTTVGQVVNLMSNDVSRFDVAIVFIHYLWIGPVTTAVVAYLLWMEIGISSVIGISAILLFIPLQMWLGKKRSILRLQTAILTDERVRLMNEIISGIQVIKMYAWEKPFAKLVTEARRKEVKEICGTSFIHGVLLSFVVFHNRLAIYCSIVAYVLLGNYINAATVFVITAYFHLARQMMSEYFPIGIGQIAEALISIKRLQKFMMCDETSVKLILPPGRHVKQNNTYFDTINKSKERLDGYKMIETLIDDHRYITSSSRNEKRCVDKGIIIKNVTAKWDAVGENTLTNVNLTVCPGELLVVIGPVGCGKSSLLHAVLGELKQNTGEILVSGNIAYSSQEPWLFDGTIRQNILFGADYNEDRYMETVEVCALSVDFQQFPYGDKTLVGERGITLSGGQRARINLARAVYKQADVYLLDDPLSAVDSHVGKHLFESCITGYLKDKTCILVTHQLQYLNCVNHMILMQNGLIQAEGTYQQVQTAGTDFTKLLLNSRSNETVEDYVNLEEPTWRSLNTDLSDKEDEPSQETELRSKGMDGYYVFQAYITAGGHYCIMLGLMLIFCLAQFVASGGDYWLTYWVNLEEYVYPQVRTDGKTSTTLAENITAISGTPTDIHLYIHMREYCIYIFTLLTVSCVIITLVRSYVFFIVCMRASMWLHNGMFDSISRATMRFFHTNSIGRILNRFTKDMGSVDDLLPVTLLEVLQIGLTLLGIVVVVAIINYWLIVPTLVAFCVFYIIRVFYLSTSRSVKRLEGSTRSPVFSHLSSSLQGLTTIRAFQAQQILEEAFDNHQDLHSSAWFMFLASSRAFGFWLDLVCLMYISLVTLSFLFIDWDWFGGDVGLAITQSIGLTGMFQWGIKQSAELENHMTSVERVLEYFNIEKEAPLESSPGKKPPESWPQEGRIIFNRVNLKYRPDLPLVLKDLTVTVEPKQKVGIVGRTGAGKTSMIAALFRLTEVEGDIIIDDLNIKTIGLHDLRSKITIIPQEPVLFSGTVRKNLDPFDEFSDHTLWNALEEVELKNVINEIPDGLNGRMSESGMNFSAGQRQLICLARAFVRNNRILVLDEATANVDPRTDALIQKTIRRQFADYTVITIAHRLHTVMDSDRILVMDAGHMVEYDHPHILLKNKSGYLYRMVEKTGKHTAETLHNVAALPDNLMWLDKLPALLLHWYVPVTGASLTSKMLVVHSTSDRVHSEVFSPTSVNRSE